SLAWRQLTTLSAGMKEFEPINVESITWQGPDGLSIQGFVLKPHNYDAAKRYPMVTVVHGGPTSAFTHVHPLSNRWIAPLVASGMVVLLPNPRGSVGWGLEFAEANAGDMGGKDFEDIMAGIDACIAAGIADP